jgi:hypothetical protein
MSSPKVPKATPPPPPPPPPPTIDEAARASEEADKLRRRKGRLATIFAGKRGGAGSVGPHQLIGKSLTGQ